MIRGSRVFIFYNENYAWWGAPEKYILQLITCKVESRDFFEMANFSHYCI